MRKISAFILTLFLSLSGVRFAVAEPPIKIGVIAWRGAEQVMKGWNETASYLSRKLGRDFRIVPLEYLEMEPAVQNKTIDFMLPGPSYFVLYEKKYNMKAISTMVNRKGIYALDKFGSVLFTRKDSKISELQDIRGKRFMCVKFDSFGGAYMALRLLKESGINPKKDCAAYTEGGSHSNVVMAVLGGHADVGTVRSNTLERMAAEGKITLDSVRIIHQINDGFPFLHSTQLYPEWPFAACQTTDLKLSHNVAKALMLLKSTDRAMKDAKVYSWTYPADYSEVANCMRVVGAF